MGSSGIPVAAGRARQYRPGEADPPLEIDFPIENLIIDPLVLTVSGCQEYCLQLIETVRTLQYAWDPACHLRHIERFNAVPAENRFPINRTYAAMLMGVGLKMMIANPLDEKLKETIRVIEQRACLHTRRRPVPEDRRPHCCNGRTNG